VCRRPVHLVIGLDTSRSVGWSQFESATSFAQSVAVSLEPRSDVGLVTFSDRPRLILNRTSINSYFISDLMTSTYDGAASTDTADALQLMCSMLSSISDQLPRVGLIVVDGRSDDFAATVREANNCWNAGIQLIAIGVGGAVSGDMYAMQELKYIVNPGDDMITDRSGNRRLQRLLVIPDFSSLSAIESTVDDILCSSAYKLPSFNRTLRTRSSIQFSTLNCKSVVEIDGETS
jgi:von Willebrand factor type A domain